MSSTTPTPHTQDPPSPQEQAARELGLVTFGAPPSTTGPQAADPVALAAIRETCPAAFGDLTDDMELLDAAAQHIAQLVTLVGGEALVEGFARVMRYTLEQWQASRALNRALMLSSIKPEGSPHAPPAPTAGE